MKGGALCRMIFHGFKNASAFLLRDARHAKHDIFLLCIFQLEPEPPQSTNTKQTAMANGAKYHWIFRTARHGGI